MAWTSLSVAELRARKDEGTAEPIADVDLSGDDDDDDLERVDSKLPNAR